MSTGTSNEQSAAGHSAESVDTEERSTPSTTPSIQSPSQGHVLVTFSFLRRPYLPLLSSISTGSRDSYRSSPITSPTQGPYPRNEGSALLFSLTLLKLDSDVFDWFSTTLGELRLNIRESLEILRQASLPTEAALRVSIAALLIQMLHRDCFVPLLQNSATSLLDKSTDSYVLLLYLVPMAVTLISLAISVTLLLQLHPVDASVMGGLVTLLVVECLVPVTVAACAGLFFAQAMTWDSALLLLVTVWITSTVSARCIRVSLYPSLGHGA